MDSEKKAKYEVIAYVLFFWMLKFTFIVAVITFAFIIFGIYVFEGVEITYCNDTMIINN